MKFLNLILKSYFSKKIYFITIHNKTLQIIKKLFQNNSIFSIIFKKLPTNLEEKRFSLNTLFLLSGTP